MVLVGVFEGVGGGVGDGHGTAFDVEPEQNG